MPDKQRTRPLRMRDCGGTFVRVAKERERGFFLQNNLEKRMQSLFGILVNRVRHGRGFIVSAGDCRMEEPKPSAARTQEKELVRRLFRPTR